MFQGLRVGAIIPAYNEELAIYQVVSELKALPGDDGNLLDDIVVCDNGSTDNTADMARHAGARVVHEARRGYGRACLTALENINDVDIVVFVDGDGSIYAEDVLALIEQFSRGYEFVLGARERHLAEAGALMPHQIAGNRLILFVIYLLWGKRYRDLGPLRAITFNHLADLKMADTSYGWTLEMQIKAIWRKIKVYELPIRYRKRIGKSKISGSVKGSILAMCKMLSVLFSMYVKQLLLRMRETKT